MQEVDTMIPGECLVEDGEIELNAGRPTCTVVVRNTGDRPIQVGSHYHFAETNAALDFDRALARGHRLNIASGTAVRFEPGQSRTVELVALGGARIVYGFRQMVMGPLDAAPQPARGARGAARPAARTAKPGARAPKPKAPAAKPRTRAAKG